MILDRRCNGATGYALDSIRGNQEITGQPLKLLKQNYLPTPFLDHKAHGTRLDIAGTEHVAGPGWRTC